MKNRALTYGTVAVILSFAAGWYMRQEHDIIPASAHTQVREDPKEYHFINPLLYTDGGEAAPEFNSLKNTLEDQVAVAIKQNQAESVSIYFRELNSGRWTGVNEEETYEPSSMLKVLVMISYLKRAETDPKILLKKLYYAPTQSSGQYYKPDNPLKQGYYTVEKLIETMIIDSDNDALYLLNKGNDEEFYKAYAVLQLPTPPTLSQSETDVPDYMSPKSYSALFRILYNSSYISREASERVLSILAKTMFSPGIVAGIPKDTPTAHKFGEHTVQDQFGNILSRQLHDCGIVYAQNNPYFLCVMTKGKDFGKLESVISSISKTVYNRATSLTGL
jgi:beta-lactamase class A